MKKSLSDNAVDYFSVYLKNKFKKSTSDARKRPKLGSEKRRGFGTDNLRATPSLSLSLSCSLSESQ